MTVDKNLDIYPNNKEDSPECWISSRALGSRFRSASNFSGYVIHLSGSQFFSTGETSMLE